MTTQPDLLNDALKGLQSANELTAAKARIVTLESKLRLMREAGDDMWYCLRHTQNLVPSEIAEAVEEWIDSRDNA